MATGVVEKGRLATGKVPRADKVEAIEVLHDRFNESTSLVLFDYRGLSVSQMTALRRQTRASGVRLSIIKNSLAERAVEGTSFEELRGKLVGPVFDCDDRRRSLGSGQNIEGLHEKRIRRRHQRRCSGWQVSRKRRGGSACGITLARSIALDAARRLAGARGGSSEGFERRHHSTGECR